MYVKTIAIGRLTKDPAEGLKEITKNGEKTMVCNFSIACNPVPGGETEFYNCSVWRAQAENLAKYMGKGQLILIEGWPKEKEWEDASGKHSRLEMQVQNIKFLEKGSKVGAPEPTVAAGEEPPF